MGSSISDETTQQVGQILKGDNAIGLRQEAIDTELNWAMTVTSRCLSRRCSRGGEGFNLRQLVFDERSHDVLVKSPENNPSVVEATDLLSP